MTRFLQKTNINSRFAEARYTGLSDYYARYIEGVQLLDACLWKKFVKVFIDHSDKDDDGWRSEYFGKMMRGGCMTYTYTKNEELYKVLKNTVENLLSTQDKYGRFSGYDLAHEFRGWDIWGRKYVLVGLEYFYEICRDDILKEKILSAMCRHADYMADKIGDGKIRITETSAWWGGVNSCSILEPIVQLYQLTGKSRYKAFAEYIISTGGCKDGNLIECLSEGKMPYEFPEVKAYETMSFFEGLLAYYEITGDEKYLDIVVKFADAVNESDITVIGCAGCTGEIFDNAAIKQTEYADTIMQETCVTVTWMRLNARLWENTFDAKYMCRIEKSALNALYGSINTRELPMYSFEKKALTPALPFDSYSPLYNNVRGRKIGGFKEFPGGGNYGCCACIGAAGTALYPLYAFVLRGNTLYANFYLSGEAETKLESGQKLKIICDNDYPASGKANLTVKLEKPEKFAVMLRAGGADIDMSGEYENGYYKIEKVWQDGEKITLDFRTELKEIHKNGKTAFTFGVFTLARDEGKESGDITEEFTPVREGGNLVYKIIDPQEGEQIRILLTCKDKEILLTDYASCGKNWAAPRNRITVWMNENQ